jgi:uncharacterized protein YlzI (FlbEa/FlbD family)
MIVAFTLTLIPLLGLDGQIIEVNPRAIVSIMKPRAATTLTGSVKCLVFLSNGKAVSIAESCDDVLAKIEAAR